MSIYNSNYCAKTFTEKDNMGSETLDLLRENNKHEGGKCCACLCCRNPDYLDLELLSLATTPTYISHFFTKEPGKALYLQTGFLLKSLFQLDTETTRLLRPGPVFNESPSEFQF